MKCLFFSISFIVSMMAHAQNTSVYSNYIFNQAVVNPASIGKDDALDVGLLYRNQWVGIKGSPTLMALSVHSPLTVANSNAGIYIINETQGEERTTQFMASYAYRQPMKFGSLSFGISAGIIQKALDGSLLRSPEGNYNASPNHNDNFIPNRSVSSITPDLNLGIYLNTRKLFVGISVNHLLESKITLDVTNTSSTFISFTRQWVFIAGYKFELSKKLILSTNVLFRSDFIKYQTNLGLVFEYKSNIYAGLSFRGISGQTKDALIMMLGVKILKKIRLGYSYDFSLSALTDATSGSHELFVNYQLKIKDLMSPGKIIYNPRNL